MDHIGDIDLTVRLAMLWIEANLVAAGFAENRNSVFLTIEPREAPLVAEEFSKRQLIKEKVLAEDKSIQRLTSSRAMRQTLSVSKTHRLQVYSSLTRAEYARGDLASYNGTPLFVEWHVDAFVLPEELLEQLQDARKRLEQVAGTRAKNPITYTIYPSRKLKDSEWRISLKLNCLRNPKRKVNFLELEKSFEGHLNNLTQAFGNIQVHLRNDAAVFHQNDPVRIADSVDTSARRSCRIAVFASRPGGETGVVVPGHALVTPGVNRLRHELLLRRGREPMTIARLSRTDLATDFAYDFKNGAVNEMDAAFLRWEPSFTHSNQIQHGTDWIELAGTTHCEFDGEYFIYKGPDGRLVPCEVVATTGTRVTMKDESATEILYTEVIVLENKQMFDGKDPLPLPLTKKGDSGAPLLRRVDGKYFLCGFVIGGGDSTSPKSHKSQSFAVPVDRVAKLLHVDIFKAAISDHGGTPQGSSTSERVGAPLEGPADAGRNGMKAFMNDKDVKRITPQVIDKITDAGGHVSKVIPRQVAPGIWKLDIDLLRPPPESLQRDFEFEGLAVHVEPPQRAVEVRRHIRIEGWDS
ncbi:hypothetical protein JQ633_08060 [Bradyrhizobium tropiciagri]|uniref:hypothetical protein n=1 Tax=Bradyrhizobium tropiciagri TaxID=312253 RepID=UPI001BA6FF15|nr:hypothetical protein [Bradyrhizobium tropiciagri]MBR0870306.1 hypothetical protein [Bradyrhizobium tropiciagri]